MHTLHTLRYATVGTGWITDSFIQGANLVDGMKLTAVYSRSEKTGRAFSQEHGDVPVYTDLEQLAASPSIDAVYIASPNVCHYAHSRLFLEQGKHVLCEKPLTVTAEQQAGLQELARQKGLIYIEAIMMLHLPARQLLRHAVESIGRVHLARFDFSQLSSKYPALQRGELPNIFNPALATGCLMDLGVYCVYAALDLFGKPNRISAQAGFLDGGADGYGSAVLEYDDLQAVLTYSKIGQSAAGSEIIGDHGTIAIESISKLTNITLVPPQAHAQPILLVEDIAKPQLMSGEAYDFYRYVGDPERYTEDIAYVQTLSLAVCETMEEIRRQCGIRFADDENAIKNS